MKLKDVAVGTKFTIMDSVFERIEDQNLPVDKHLYGGNKCKKIKMNAKVIILSEEETEENPHGEQPVFVRGIMSPGRLVRFGPNREVKILKENPTL